MKYNKKINEFIESNPSLLKIKNDFNLLIESKKYRVLKLEFITETGVSTYYLPELRTT